jgi:hypothetical protein
LRDGATFTVDAERNALDAVTLPNQYGFTFRHSPFARSILNYEPTELLVKIVEALVDNSFSFKCSARAPQLIGTNGPRTRR